MRGAANICVFLTGAIGDFILALPALRRLRSALPESSIHLAGNPLWLPLARQCLVVDIAISVENLPLHAGFMESLARDHPLSMFLSRFDFVISWFGDRDGRLEGNLSRILPGRALVVPFHRSGSFPGHVSEFFLQTLDTMDLPNSVESNLPLWPSSWNWQPPRLRGIYGQGDSESSEPGLCIHPGSGSPKKNWPREHFLEIARTARESWRVPLQIILGPAEEADRAFWDDAGRYGLSVLTGLSLNGIAETLSQSALYLGNDSGITHLAASLGVPTVALFGPTEPSRWAPMGPRVQVLRNPGPKEVMEALVGLM